MDRIIRYIRYLSIFFAIALFFLYRPHSLDIPGHWHVYRYTSDSTSAFTQISTIDILNDSTAIWDQFVQSRGMGGYVDKKAQTIRFGGECLMLNFRYSWEGEQLLLHQEYYDEEDPISYLAERCDENCCDREQEFFTYSPVEISLPVFIDTVGLLRRIAEPSRISNIEFGLPKIKYAMACPPSKHRLILGHKFALVSDIDIWKLKHLIKLPEYQRTFWRAAIYADRRTPFWRLLPVLRQLRALGETEFYLAGKANTNTFQIWYWPILLEELDLDWEPSQDITLEIWLDQI